MKKKKSFARAFFKKSRHCEGDTLYKSRGAIMVKMLTMVVFLSVAVSHNAEVLVLSV